MSSDDPFGLRTLADPLPIQPLDQPFHRTIRPPGSKSITNRVYVLAALAHGETRICRPLRAEDCDRLLHALQTLGAAHRFDGDDVIITGVGGRFPRGGTVNLGDGGTPTRFMIAAACLADETVVVDGSPRMRERPVAEGIALLRSLGANIESLDEGGRLPVRVTPAPLRGGTLEVGRTASSQFISAIMLIAPSLDAEIAFEFFEEPTSASYLTLTRRIVSAFDRADGLFHVAPDASSAVYWHAAAALVPEATMSIDGLDGLQPDERAIAALPGYADGRTVGSSSFALGTIDATLWPDGALCLAAVAACATAPTTITGLTTLRVKETDRIGALQAELERVGCLVSATDDALMIDPTSMHDRPVVIQTYNDHRMAMAFAILGLVRGGISIADPACVEKSYPGFWRDLASLA